MYETSDESKKTQEKRRQKIQSETDNLQIVANER